MSTLSIIVTVYNLEKYIEECLQSLLNQSLKDIEIVVIDDGSTDKSGEICDRVAQKDSRVRIFHEKNGGRVLARQMGVERCGSDYVTFVDGDDWVDSIMYECLMENMLSTGADLVVSGYKEVRGNVYKEKHTAIAPGIYRTLDEMDYLKKNWFCFEGRDELGAYASVWAKIYRRNLINGIFELIPEQLYRGEDLLFNGIYLSKCKIVSFVDDLFYFYRQHNESTVNKKCQDLFLQIGYIQDVLTNVYAGSDIVLQSINARNFLNFIRLWNFENDSGMFHIPYYTYDYSWFEGKTIALYGAGKVGRDYYWFLSKVNPGTLKVWVDKNYSEARASGYDVDEIICLQKYDYDEILIAIESEQTAKEIENELRLKLNINKKIIWHAPKHCWI